MENRKTTDASKRKTVEIVAIIFFVITVGITWLADLSVIPIHQILIMRIAATEDLLFALFSVQASIATVSIAIISIITGLTDKNYLGVSISEFITTINPAILTHKRLIIVSLLLAVCSYIAMAYKWVNLCIALFVFTVLIAVQLVSDVYIIFGGAQRVHDKIQKYILENYDESRITAIKNELIKAIDTNDLLVINQDKEIIKDIFQRDLQNGELVIEHLIRTVIEVFSKTIEQHNSIRTNDMLTYINELYVLANSNQGRVVPIDLWEQIHYEYYKALQDLTDEHINEKACYRVLHKELYRNLETGSDGEIQNNYLKFFSSWTYSALFSKQPGMDSTTKSVTKRRLYEMTEIPLLYDKEQSRVSIKMLQVQELCNLLRTTIDAGDCELFNKHFIKNYQYHTRNEYFELVLIITLIYLYYLSSRETIASGKEAQETARKILQDNKNTISYFYDNISILEAVEKHKEFIHTILSKWEQMDMGEVKRVIMHYVIDDFLILTACTQFWDKESIRQMVDYIADNGIFSLYDRYFQNKKSTVATLLEKYISLFANGNFKSDFVEEKIGMLHDIFNEKYVQEALNNGRNERIEDDDVRRYIKKIKEEFNGFISRNLLRFPLKLCEIEGKVPVVTEREQTILSIRLPHSMIREETVHSVVRDHMNGNIMTLFLHRFLDQLDFSEIKYDRRDKQQFLIDKVNALGIQSDTVIGNRDNFWGENDRNLLQKYTSNMRRLEYPSGYNTYFIIDSKRVAFTVENVAIDFSNEPEKDILERCEMCEDGRYLYNITNDIYIPFTKDELVSYIHNTEKVITVVADLKYRARTNKVGAGIEIVTELSEDLDT